MRVILSLKILLPPPAPPRMVDYRGQGRQPKCWMSAQVAGLGIPTTASWALGLLPTSRVSTKRSINSISSQKLKHLWCRFCKSKSGICLAAKHPNHKTHFYPFFIHAKAKIVLLSVENICKRERNYLISSIKQCQLSSGIICCDRNWRSSMPCPLSDFEHLDQYTEYNYPSPPIW